MPALTAHRIALEDQPVQGSLDDGGLARREVVLSRQRHHLSSPLRCESK